LVFNPNQRGAAVRRAAAAAGVPLTAVTIGKPKSHPSRKFGIANAINTGVLLARGRAVQGVNSIHPEIESAWFPPLNLERDLVLVSVRNLLSHAQNMRNSCRYGAGRSSPY
jgi:hypothetical protein